MTPGITHAWLRPLAAVVALLGLSACAETIGASVILASLSATKKLPTDHLVSWISGEDCSVVTMAENGSYCRDEADATMTLAAAPLYCYRTLGEVTCYATPDDQASDSRRVQ